ncbi:MAG: hypothetical protein M1827_004256 [Pycnora praestabilis]|nr:MAG: hypothetical protein M1827_004256 [Pycnora praestabilis]
MGVVTRSGRKLITLARGLRSKSKKKKAASQQYPLPPILDLPGEIRNKVYGLIFPTHQKILLLDDTAYYGPARQFLIEPYQQRGPNLPADATVKARDLLSILSTCKQMNHEIAGLFYGTNHFRFNTTAHFHSFLKGIGPFKTACLRRVTISLNLATDENLLHLGPALMLLNASNTGGAGTGTAAGDGGRVREIIATWMTEVGRLARLEVVIRALNGVGWETGRLWADHTWPGPSVRNFCEIKRSNDG